VKLYKRATELGDVAAMNDFALHCMWGEGVKCDPKKAIRLWRVAADRGHAAAQWILGFFYENGSRIERVNDFEVDLWEARRLYGRSAAQGFQHAKDDLDDLTLRITEAMVDQKLDGLELDMASVRRGQSVRPRAREGPFRLLG
jgi:TPR repeat protein